MSEANDEPSASIASASKTMREAAFYLDRKLSSVSSSYYNIKETVDRHVREANRHTRGGMADEFNWPDYTWPSQEYSESIDALKQARNNIVDVINNLATTIESIGLLDGNLDDAIDKAAEASVSGKGSAKAIADLAAAVVKERISEVSDALESAVNSLRAFEGAQDTIYEAAAVLGTGEQSISKWSRVASEELASKSKRRSY